MGSSESVSVRLGRERQGKDEMGEWRERVLIQQHGLRYVLISGLTYVLLWEVSLDDWLAVWLVDGE